jgi:DNA-binding LacI/PurR family transcriptional regulator
MKKKDALPKGWATSADVAARAGVSRSAVSRTFTEGASVSPATRARVLKAAEELGYQVNRLARSVIQRQSSLVGIVVPGMQNEFVVQLLGPLAENLAHHSLAPLLIDARDPAQMASKLRYLLQYRVAGVIFTSGSPPIELAQEYLRLRVPVAMINRDANLESVDVVTSDNQEGGTLAADCLIKGGARRLAYVNLPSGTYSGISRGAGFSEAVARSGIASISLELVQGTIPDYAGGVDVAAQLLDRPPERRPDGVFCANDLLAFGFLDAARYDFGLRVPEDIAIVGFDDIPMASTRGFALTTIRQDVEALAREAVGLLVQRMAEPTTLARTRRIPVQLVPRATSKS